MIPEMITSAYLSIGASGTNGYSESARFIAEQITLSQQDLQKPEFYFSVMKRVLSELMQIAFVGSKAGWDGYNALPISSETSRLARTFLESLPNSIPSPAVGAEPDGQITFEWYRSPHRVLSLSISPEGDLHYAALIGPNKAYGAEVFYGDVPSVIHDLIRRVYAS